MTLKKAFTRMLLQYRCVKVTIFNIMMEGFLHILYIILFLFYSVFCLCKSKFIVTYWTEERHSEQQIFIKCANIRMWEWTKYQTRLRLSSKRDVKNEYPHLTQIMVMLTHTTGFFNILKLKRICLNLGLCIQRMSNVTREPLTLSTSIAGTTWLTKS